MGFLVEALSRQVLAGGIVRGITQVFIVAASPRCGWHLFSLFINKPIDAYYTEYAQEEVGPEPGYVESDPRKLNG